jgi:hypothetical protein
VDLMDARDSARSGRAQPHAFRINPGRISRAVVTARRGTRVANFPVDILPGEAVNVALSLP